MSGRFARTVLGALALSGCRGADRAASAPAAPSYAIDAGFLFGAAVAGYQVEGGNDAGDWSAWEGQGAEPDAGVCPTVLDCAQANLGPGFAAHARADVASAAGLGLNALRFSLEWERLQPVAPGAGATYDAAALAYYHGLVDSCLDAGLTPVATLSQGTLPGWLHNDTVLPGQWVGGWRGYPQLGNSPGPGDRVVQQFVRFAGDMAREFGGQVRIWIPFDQPMETALAAYLEGTFPPGGVDHLSDLRAAVINLAYANGGAYAAIHQYAPADAGPGTGPLLVGSAHRFQSYQALATDGDAGAQAAQRAAYLGNFLLPNAFINGDLDTHFDQRIGHPGDPEGEGLALTGLAGSADFLGVSFRGPLTVHPGVRVDAQAVADAGLLPLTWPGSWTFADAGPGGNTDPPVSEPIAPQDLQAVLEAVAAAYPVTPIYVTELTFNEQAQPDRQRPRFLVQAVAAIQAAMAQGVPVRGLFYRSLVDGFEWQLGFAARSGLLRVNFDDPSRARTPTSGGQALGDLARAAGVTPAIRTRWAR